MANTVDKDILTLIYQLQSETGKDLSPSVCEHLDKIDKRLKSPKIKVKEDGTLVLER